MSDRMSPTVAIIDFGMGNLFSVKRACEHWGMNAVITSSHQDILSADAAVLPGVGAFGDAMEAIRRLNLVVVLEEVVASSKPLVGVCLGMQLLMTESFEFGRHAGLGFVPGAVVRLEKPQGPSGVVKVPQVCWNQIYRSRGEGESWPTPLMKGLPNGVYMYFNHSYYVKPDDPAVSAGITSYRGTEFCSVLTSRNIFAFQCHPERSGPMGLLVYRNLASLLAKERGDS